MKELNKEFWSQRYEACTTGWDIGYPSDPLVEYIDQLTDKSLKILTPGAGNAYEAEHLWKLGFKQVHVLDLARQPLENLKKRIPEFPDDQLIQDNFFEHRGSYDRILEQTFFCALTPTLRANYAQHCASLLNQKGKIAGVMFDFPLGDNGPPFGGSKEEYRELFSKLFTIRHLERCHNSIAPRSGNELFVVFEKKDV